MLRRSLAMDIASLRFQQLLGLFEGLASAWLPLGCVPVEAAPLWTMFYPAEPATTFPEEDTDLQYVGAGCGGFCRKRRKVWQTFLAHPCCVEHGCELLGFRKGNAQYSQVELIVGLRSANFSQTSFELEVK